ncbi:MAG: hypothetical protein ABSG24_05890 [Acidimicrobiales bacterium]
MSEPIDRPIASEGPASARANDEPPLDRHVSSLRGAAGASVGRRFWLVAGALGLVVFTAALVVGFLSVAHDHARVERLKDHGIPVTVTVIDCIGNVGGSGSNGAGYTCRGHYTVGATSYRELIGSMTTFSASGTKVRAVADPAHHSSVTLASAVEASSTSSGSFVVLGLLSLGLVALTLALIRVARRSNSPGHAPSAPPGTSGD